MLFRRIIRNLQCGLYDNETVQVDIYALPSQIMNVNPRGGNDVFMLETIVGKCLKFSRIIPFIPHFLSYPLGTVTLRIESRGE